MFNYEKYICDKKGKKLFETQTALIHAILAYREAEGKKKTMKDDLVAHRREFSNLNTFFTNINSGIGRKFKDEFLSDLKGALVLKTKNESEATLIVEALKKNYIESKNAEKKNEGNSGKKFSKPFNVMLKTVIDARSAIIITSDPIEGDGTPTPDLKHFREERIIDIVKSFLGLKEKKEYMFLVPTMDIANKLWSDFKILFDEVVSADAEVLQKIPASFKSNSFIQTFEDSLYNEICAKGILKIYAVKTPIFTPKAYIVTNPNIPEDTSSFIYAKKNSRDIEILKSLGDEIKLWRQHTWSRIPQELSEKRIIEALPNRKEQEVESEFIFTKFGLHKVA